LAPRTTRPGWPSCWRAPRGSSTACWHRRTGEPRPPLDAVIDQLNAAAAPKLAIDLPSGLDCDTGKPARHTIRAAETCTFVTAKVGFFAPEAAVYVGRLHVLDIGVPRKLIERVRAETLQRPEGLGT